jgi:hypothetical protein
MPEVIEPSPKVEKEPLPAASQILAMAAKKNYATPCVKTHRLDGARTDGPLTMSGNI